MRYIPVIGLELHAELLTKSKIFCACENSFGGIPNSRVCPRCAGFPGTLPLLNQEAVALAAKAGFALNCTVHEHSAFDRKNYFYPDLPKAYQITQMKAPLCTDGFLQVEGKKIRISRIHMEEDAGKLLHDADDTHSLVDYNRCGVPLIEIVTEPDFRSPQEVQAFVEQAALCLKYADICDGRMEQGSLRVDVNISLMEPDARELGTRAELKNLNSYKAISRAIAYEIQRQTEILDSGGRVVQETRRFEENSGKTYSLRSKEEAHDYRYFPEPDLPPVQISSQLLYALRASLPEMPQKRARRYLQSGLHPEEVRLLTADRTLSDFFDYAVQCYPAPKTIANLILGELLRQMNEAQISPAQLRFSPQALGSLAELSDTGAVSKGAARALLVLLFHQGGDPKKLAEENGFLMSSDKDALIGIIEHILTGRPEQVQSYLAGEEKLLGFFMGQVMREAGKSADPQLAKALLIQQLKSRKESAPS